MRTPRVLLGLATAAALLLGQPAHAEGPPPPGLGVRLLDAPTNRADDPRARSYIVDRVAPGAIFTRHIEVSNGDPTPMDVLIYPAPATVSNGQFVVGDRGTPGEIPDWVTVSPRAAHLAPGARQTVAVTFRVPSDAASGEFYGAIVAERPPTKATGLGVATRAGIRVYLSVGKGGEPPSDFTVDSLTAARDAAGRPIVLAQVHNTGGRALDMSGTLRLTRGPGGLSAGPFNATVGTTLGIGQTEPVTVVLDKALPAGPWLATLELHSGRIGRKVAGTITFPDHASTKAAPVVPKELPLYAKRTVVVPVAASLIGLVSLGLLVLALLAWLRRRRQEPQ